jgi:hypothetical protein
MNLPHEGPVMTVKNGGQKLIISFALLDNLTESVYHVLNFVLKYTGVRVTR